MAEVLDRNTKKNLIIDMPDIEIMQICSAINILLKYN